MGVEGGQEGYGLGLVPVESDYAGHLFRGGQRVAGFGTERLLG